jgi:hypothetical protein
VMKAAVGRDRAEEAGDTVEAAVREPYAVPVMIVKGVHRPAPAENQPAE